MFLPFSLIALFFCLTSQAMENKEKQTEADSPQELVNYFQYIPRDAQNCIAEYLIPYPGRETPQDLLNKFNPLQLLFSKNKSPIAAGNFTFSINNGNLQSYDKVKKKTVTLIKINKNKSFLKKGYNFVKEAVTNTINTQNEITKFAFSPNKQYLVALESLCKLGKEENQNGLWFVDLQSKLATFIKIPEFANVRLDTITDANRAEYENNGYQSLGFSYDGKNTFWCMKKLFEAIAVNNNKKIAFADRKSVYCIDTETAIYKVKKTFDKPKKSIKSIEFNKQGTTLVISFEQENADSSFSIVSEFVDFAQEPQKTLAEYFYKRRVCTPKQLKWDAEQQ